MGVRLGLGSHLTALIKEPILLWEALLAFFSVRRRRSVFPSSDYLGWRLATAYGSANTQAPSVDMVHYLRWRRQMRKITKWDQVT